MITLEKSLIKERLYIYVKVFHLTVAKTSIVGMSGGKPKIILAARQCCLSNVLNNSV